LRKEAEQKKRRGGRRQNGKEVKPAFRFWEGWRGEENECCGANCSLGENQEEEAAGDSHAARGRPTVSGHASLVWPPPSRQNKVATQDEGPCS